MIWEAAKSLLRESTRTFGAGLAIGSLASFLPSPFGLAALAVLSYRAMVGFTERDLFDPSPAAARFDLLVLFAGEAAAVFFWGLFSRL